LPFANNSTTGNSTFWTASKLTGFGKIFGNRTLRTLKFVVYILSVWKSVRFDVYWRLRILKKKKKEIELPRFKRFLPPKLYRLIWLSVEKNIVGNKFFVFLTISVNTHLNFHNFKNNTSPVDTLQLSDEFQYYFGRTRNVTSFAVA